MKVNELINKLHKMPQHMTVAAWDANEDEYMPIVDVCYEQGHITVDLMTNTSRTGKKTECDHKWVLEGHNAGDPVCVKCGSKDCGE